MGIRVRNRPINLQNFIVNNYNFEKVKKLKYVGIVVNSSNDVAIDINNSLVICWEVLEWLHNWRLLKKGSAP
jgi:hypothetical protein